MPGAGPVDQSKANDLLILELRAQLAAREREISRLRTTKESTFRSLFDRLPKGFALHEIILDDDGKPVDYRFLEVNPAFERLTGLKHEAVVGKTAKAVVPGIEAYWIDTFGRVAVEGSPVRFEQYSAPLSRWYQVYAYNTAPGRFAVIFTDITERKRSEAELKDASGKLASQIEEKTRALELAELSVEQERKRLRDVFDMLPAYLILLSPEYKVPFANRYFEDRFGRSCGRRCYEYLFQRSAPCDGCESFKVLETRAPHRWEWIGPDGRHYDIYDFPFADTDGSPLVMEMGIDITERKKAESALQKLNQELEQRVAQRTAELRSSEKRLQLMAVVAERLLRAENPQTIIQDLCRLVMAHIDCQFFFNYLVEGRGDRMLLNAYAGIPAEAAADIGRLDFGAAVCGCFARDRERIVAQDTRNSRDPLTERLRALGIQALCCHPLRAHDKTIGTLSFGTAKRPKFTEDEIALMKSFCDQVSVALQRLMTEKELRQLNETLEWRVAERTEIAETRSKQLQSLAIELIEAEEKERRRLAGLLHDDLQQMLAAAKMQLQLISADAQHDPILRNVSEILEASIAQSRQLSHELSPAVLQTSGLVAALKWLARHMGRQFGFTIETEVSFDQEIENPPLKIFIFSAVRELLFNCVKHAGVKRARVTLSQDRRNLVTRVIDEGNGFNPATVNDPQRIAGLGILRIRERARFMGGDLNVESSLGKGSRFTLTIPMQS